MEKMFRTVGGFLPADSLQRVQPHDEASRKAVRSIVR